MDIFYLASLDENNTNDLSNKMRYMHVCISKIEFQLTFDRTTPWKVGQCSETEAID